MLGKQSALLLISTTVSVVKKYKDVEAVVKIEEVDGEELVKKFAEEMEEMLGRKMKSVKVTMIHSVNANTLKYCRHDLFSFLNNDK